MNKLRTLNGSLCERIILTMKFVSIFLLASIYNAFAISQAQNEKITVKVNDATFQEVISQIENQSGYIFFYKSEDVDNNRRFNLRAENKTVIEVLKMLIQKTALSYEISDNYIFLRKKDLSDHAKVMEQRPQKKITGKITDEKGEPIIGATISVKEEKGKGTISDINGDYMILIDSHHKILLFSCIGYETQEHKIGKEDVMDITLEESLEALEEVVVVGYGSQKKQTVVSAVESIRPGDLKVTGGQLSTSFAGRLSGLISYQRTGEPGNDGAAILIRGYASPNSTSPLIIIDGIQQTVSELNYLDPSVIKDFSVLKDASATALYGTLGANGVILVNTKIGEQMKKPRITTRIEERMQTPTPDINYVDGVEFMKLYNEAIQHPNSSEFAGSAYNDEKIRMTEEGKYPLVYPNINWKEEVFKKISHSQRAIIDIEGGSSRATYFTSLSVLHEGGLLKNRAPEFRSFNNDINLMTYVLKNNFGINLTPSTKLDSRLSVRLHNGVTPNTQVKNMFNYIRRSNPVDFPIIFDKEDPKVQYLDGNQGDIHAFRHLLWGGNQKTPNAIAELVDGFSSRFSSTINANVDLAQKFDFLTQGLSAKLSFNFKNYSATDVRREISYNRYFVQSTQLNENNDLENYALQRAYTDIREENFRTSNWSEGDREFFFQSLLNYSRIFLKKHDINAMLMYNQTEWYNNSPGESDLFASLPKRKQSFSGRFTYSFEKKYNIEANFGATGSENFAKGHRWGFFPSLGFSYTISQEKFWEPLEKAIPFLKLRFSKGKAGNDYIGGNLRFAFQEQITLNKLGYMTGRNNNNPYRRSGPLYERFRNENLSWEIADKSNIGLDLNILNDIDFSIDFFKENREKVFVQRATIPGFLGLAGTEILTNMGAVKNQGIDASLGYGKKIAPDFDLSLRGTFTYAHNEYVKWDEPDFMEYPALSRIGQPLSRESMLIADGLIKTEEEADAINHNFGSNLSVGDIKYIDQPNGEGVKNNIIDYNDELFYGYPTVPEIVYGLSTDLKYKRWNLSFLFQGQERVSLIIRSFVTPFGIERNNIPQFMADNHFSVEKQNFDAEFPRLSANPSDYNNAWSTFYYRDASFLKLKYVELGYTVNKFFIYASANNALTLSRFKLWDPERGGYGVNTQYPTMITFALGLKITF